MGWGFWQKKPVDSVGIVLSTHGLSWARLCLQPAPCLLHCGEQLLNGQELPVVLAELANRGEFDHADLHLILAPGQYQLTLTEAPQVADEELAAALRWRVAELLSYDANDARLDAFALPEDAYRGRQRMAYIASCPQNAIVSLERSFASARLELQSISIPEVACLHLGRRLQPQDSGRALVMLGNNDCQIVLIQNAHLYLTRQAPLGWQRLHNSQDFEALLLEIQRSLDYYDSQIGKGMVREVLISAHERAAELAAYLDQNLTPQVSLLDLGSVLERAAEYADPEQTLAVGAALRGLA